MAIRVGKALGSCDLLFFVELLFWFVLVSILVVFLLGRGGLFEGGVKGYGCIESVSPGEGEADANLVS